MADPFAPAEMTIDFVSAAAGAGKTLEAIRQALAKARHGDKTVIAMPTTALIKEMVGFAKRTDPSARVVVIDRDTDPGKVRQTILAHLAEETRGGLLFVTHAGLDLVAEWPAEAGGWHCIVDEEPEVVLAKRPFLLSDSHWTLTSFLDVAAVPTTVAERQQRPPPPPEYSERPEGSTDSKRYDSDRLATVTLLLDPQANAAPTEVENALKLGKRLLAKKIAWAQWLAEGQRFDAAGRDLATSYYRIVAKPADDDPADPLKWIRRRVANIARDDIYKYIDPVPLWLLQDVPLFTEMTAWNRMTIDRRTPDRQRGMVSVIGFRRPDRLKAFRSVTLMSALLEHSLTYQIWSKLGVNFRRSETIKIDQPLTPLGSRKLTIYTLFDEGWSKRARDRSGGIQTVFEVISNNKLVDPEQPVAIVLNVDDDTVDNQRQLRALFPDYKPMPNRVRGQNEYRHIHQIVHLSALNSFTADIVWLERVFGIASREQRIARAGCEIYQALMRSGLREPNDTHDVSLVVMDHDVGLWLQQWFAPADQVEVIAIDTSDVLQRRGRPGRPRLAKPKSGRERTAEWRRRKKGK